MEVKIKQGNEMLDATIEMVDGVISEYILANLRTIWMVILKRQYATLIIYQ
jgi:hypothetical protein